MIFAPAGGMGAVSTIGGTGTSLKKFQSNVLYTTGPNLGLVFPFYGTATDYLIPVAGGGQNSNGRVGGVRFGVKASGNVYVHGTSPTLNFQLLGDLGNTPTTDVDMLTLTSAQALTTATSYDWTLSVELYGSAAPASAGKVGGSGSLQVANASLLLGSTITPVTSMTAAALTSVNFAGTYNTDYPTGSHDGIVYPAFFLKFGLTFGVSDAANLASITEFYAYTDY